MREKSGIVLGGNIEKWRGEVFEQRMLIFFALITVLGAYGMMLYYQARQEAQSGGVAARWYSNFDRLTNSIPDDLLGLFGNHATLKQGSWDVEDQFGYSWAIAKDAEMAAYFAGFRQSFAIVGFVHHDRSAFPTLPSLNVTLPGFVSAQNK